MKLFHSQYTRSGRPRWALEEIGAPYECERVSLMKGEHKKPEFLAINPMGAVPALIDGDLTLTESSAIVMHLADKFPEAKLLPALGTNARAECYRWIVYVPASLDPVLMTLTMQTRFLPEDKRSPAVLEQAKQQLGNIMKVLENAIGGRPFIVGDSFTAADIVLGSAGGWLGFLGMLGDYPAFAAYFQGLAQRPAYVRAHAD